MACSGSGSNSAAGVRTYKFLTGLKYTAVLAGYLPAFLAVLLSEPSVGGKNLNHGYLVRRLRQPTAISEPLGDESIVFVAACPGSVGVEVEVLAGQLDDGLTAGPMSAVLGARVGDSRHLCSSSFQFQNGIYRFGSRKTGCTVDRRQVIQVVVSAVLRESCGDRI